MTGPIRGSGQIEELRRHRVAPGRKDRQVTKVLFLTAVVLLPAWFVVSRRASQQKVEIEHQKDEIARGRYLVEEVAKCPECHTPRNARGELDRGAWLEGAPIWIMPVSPMRNWADRAPALAEC